MEEKSLQEKYAPNSICFGCGPANPQGLQIQSMLSGDTLVCTWQPSGHHQAFTGMLNGGIIGSLLDCHSNWAAAWHLMKKNKWEKPRCTVTAKYSVTLLRPTPSNREVYLIAKVVESKEDRAVVEASLLSNAKECAKEYAKCLGTFVAVQPGHPAYHRW